MLGNLPEEIVRLVFYNLDVVSLSRVSRVCKNFYRIAGDDFLWKSHFLAKWTVPNPPAGKGDNWRDEFKRLTAKVPLVECGTNFFHSHQVLHVTFSKKGDLFATCSKDGFVIVWNFEPDYVDFASIKHSILTRDFHWVYPHRSAFNDSGDLLLVTGSLDGYASGQSEVAVFRIDAAGWKLQSLTETYSPFCPWIDDSVYLRLSYDSGAPGSVVYRSYSHNKSDEALYLDSDHCEHFLLATDLKDQKWLIYAAGTFLGIHPHEVCFKRIPAQRAAIPPTPPDHCIDIKATIVGMSLSPDDRVLFVNSRPWVEDIGPENELLYKMPISKEIQIHAFDLSTYIELPTSPMTGHKAFSAGNGFFLIYTDACDEFVATGSEDGFAYIFDRRHGVCAAKLRHEKVVNSVAFHPRSSEIILTASDDYTVKLWMSRVQSAEKNMYQRGE